MRHTAETLPNPRLAKVASSICDPDGLLSSSMKNSLDHVISSDTKKLEIGVVVVKRLQQGLKLSEFAPRVVDLWGIGDKIRNDGVLYVLVQLQRQHHLFAGRGVLGELSSNARQDILDGLQAHLRAGDLDGAVQAAVLAVIARVKSVRRFRKRWGPVIRACAATFIVWLVASLWSWAQRVRRRRARDLEYGQQQLRLNEAREQLQQMGLTSQLDAPCCVCLECLAGHDNDQGPAAARNIRLEDWQILDDSEGGGAVAHGLEMFRCGHLLHRNCACQTLAVRNACPLCRAADPRIFAVGAAALATAYASAHAEIFDEIRWRDSADFLFEDVVQARAEARAVAEARERAREAAEHAERTDSWRGSGLGGDWGGGSSIGGAGTTSSW